jgi:hypothetical protein
VGVTRLWHATARDRLVGQRVPLDDRDGLEAIDQNASGE